MRGIFGVLKKTVIRSEMQEFYVVLQAERRRLLFFASEDTFAQKHRPMMDIEVAGIIEWDGSGFINKYNHAFAFRATVGSGGETYQV